MSTRDLGRCEAEGGAPRERLPQEQRPDRGSQEGSARAPLDLLTATDRLTLAYLAGLAALAVWSDPKSGFLLLGIGILAIAVVGVAVWGARSGLGRVIHDFFPVPMVVCTFSLTGPVIAAVNPILWDARLAALDRELFPGLAAAWYGALGRPWWLSDAAALLYFSYYVIPLVMGVALYRAGRRMEFDAFVFTVVATFLVSYVCYFVTPTLGPRIPIDREATVLGGAGLSRGLRWFLHAVEFNQLDAFPSGHTAVSIVLFTLGWRLFPRWRLPMSLLVVGIVFSTVYLSLHYVIDLIGGALLAAFMPLLLPVLRFGVGPRDHRPSSKARQRPPDQPIRSNRPLR
ncbi:MAG TPA: phosphatase PAP2 family protein [Myxococcota bacterium]|nr:phosphatase PAP2 family protein [Myxococcota bacterium]